MASKSGGTIPARQPIVDANQALAVLDALHFWSASKHNSNGRSSYIVKITHAGRRVNGHGRTFLLATLQALANLRKDDPVMSVPHMRIVT